MSSLERRDRVALNLGASDHPATDEKDYQYETLHAEAESAPPRFWQGSIRHLGRPECQLWLLVHPFHVHAHFNPTCPFQLWFSRDTFSMSRQRGLWKGGQWD
jgi:hypothetical protein